MAGVPGQGRPHSVAIADVLAWHAVCRLKDLKFPRLSPPWPPCTSSPPQQQTRCAGHLLLLAPLTPRRHSPLIHYSLLCAGGGRCIGRCACGCRQAQHRSHHPRPGGRSSLRLFPCRQLVSLRALNQTLSPLHCRHSTLINAPCAPSCRKLMMMQPFLQSSPRPSFKTTRWVSSCKHSYLLPACMLTPLASNVLLPASSVLQRLGPCAHVSMYSAGEQSGSGCL